MLEHRDQNGPCGFVLTLTLTHMGTLPGCPPFFHSRVHFLKYVLSSQRGSGAVLSDSRQRPVPSPRTEREQSCRGAGCEEMASVGRRAAPTSLLGDRRLCSVLGVTGERIPMAWNL